MKNKHESDNMAKKNYESVMDDAKNEPTKGVHLGNSPYLWRENNPAHPYADTPCENFVPTPTMHSGEDSKLKRILKHVAIGLFVAFLIYTFVMICLDAPQSLFTGDTGRGHFFR